MNWANFTKVKTFFAENWKILFAIASAFSAGGGTVHAKHVIKRRLLKCPSCNYIDDAKKFHHIKDPNSGGDGDLFDPEANNHHGHHHHGKKHEQSLDDNENKDKTPTTTTIKKPEEPPTKPSEGKEPAPPVNNVGPVVGTVTANGNKNLKPVPSHTTRYVEI